MSTGRDDLRDDAVVRAWREHMQETPPAALDDAIRAAARRAVGAKPREKPLVAEAREPWRWWMPLAAAATIGAIAIGVIQNLPRDASEPTIVSDATTARRAAPAAPPAATPPAVEPRASGEGADRKEASPEAAAPKVAADALRAPSPEQRDRVPLPLPRSETARSQAPAAPAPLRQEATKREASPRSDAPSEAKGNVAPPVDQRLAAVAPELPAAALGKRADEATASPRSNERDGESGFVASPPPASEPAIVAAARQAAPASPAPAAAAEAAGATRAEPEAAESPARAKVRAAPAASTTTGSAADVISARATKGRPAPAGTSPDVFIDGIRRLLAADDRAGAVRELQRFRRTHADADARLPPDLREFAASVPRP